MDSNLPYNRFDTENASHQNQASGDPTLYVVAPLSSHVMYNPRKLGLIQIVCGGMSIILNIVTLILHTIMSATGVGIGGGILFILTGSFQIKLMKTKTRCLFKTSFIFTILAAISSMVIVICCSLDIVLASEGQDDFMYDSDEPHQAVLVYVMNALLIGVGIFECVVAILSSKLSYRLLRYTSQTLVVQEMPHESTNHSVHPDNP